MGGTYVVEDLNFPESHKMYNPTNENVDLKTILEKLKSHEEVKTKHINDLDFEYIKNNIETITFYKGSGKYSEIVFIKKKY